MTYRSLHPITFWSCLTLTITTLGFLGGGLALHFTEIDNTLVTEGKTISKGRTALIRHREGHRLTEIFIQPGTFVRMGDPLFKFDTSDLEIKAKNLVEQQAIMASRMHRLQTELMWLATQQKGSFLPVAHTQSNQNSGPFLNVTAPHPEERGSFLDTSLLAVNQEKMRTQLASLTQQKAEMALLLQTMLQQHKIMREQVSLLQQDQKNITRLAQKGIVTKTKLRQKKLSHLSQKAKLYDLESDIMQSKQKLTILEQQMRTLIGENAQNILDDLQNIEQKGTELRFQIRRVAQQLEHSIVRATLSGWIENMVDLSQGRTIGPNEILCTIVASDDIQVEFNVPPHKRGLVTIEAPLRLQVRDGSAVLPVTYHGKVTHVSADIREASGEKPHYRATAHITTRANPHLQQAHIMRPGLPVTIAVRGEQQSLLAYLTAPLSQFWTHAFQH